MATKNETQIWVYADWAELEGCKPFGLLTAQRVRGKEIFSFEYDTDWIQQDQALYLDPNLVLFKGKQFLNEDKSNFGLFLDSSPDRWGRLLMRRREAAMAKLEKRPEKTLMEIDYLIGVYDGHRLGGLRFKLSPSGEFMNNNKELASPPWTSLSELEYASLQLEKADAINDPEYNKWLSILVDPGSSLGGARPKASVLDKKGQLWIAKFPSASDEKNSAAWEMVIYQLAAKCGIQVPEARLMRFSGRHHTFLSRRFDRTPDQKRIHFASAMALLGHNDGDDFTEGISYLEMATFLIQQGAVVTKDLEQLWRRMVFNILVSNTDDHLRNHGFLLTSTGWRLSPAYDMNPNERGTGLKLNITESNNELDVSLALEVAKYFKLNSEKANSVLDEVKNSVRNWKTVARNYYISNDEIELTKNAFRLVD